MKWPSSSAPVLRKSASSSSLMGNATAFSEHSRLACVPNGHVARCTIVDSHDACRPHRLQAYVPFSLSILTGSVSDRFFAIAGDRDRLDFDACAFRKRGHLHG